MRPIYLIFATTVLALPFVESTSRAVDPRPKRPTSAPATAPVAEVQKDGTVLLKPEGARILGYKMHLDPKPVPTLIYWIDPRESVEWPKAVKKGKYLVELTYSCPENAGGEFILSAAASKVNGRTERTADWQTYMTAKIGTITVLNDDTSISLHSNGFNRALMNVRLVKLTPVVDAANK